MIHRPARAVSGWALAVVPSVLVPLLVLLAFDPRYLFYGDTQAAYLGWQHHLGEQLLAGHWPLLDPQAWQAGNLVAEGQAGLFNPVIMALGLLATVSGNVLVLTAVTKLVLVCAGATGVYVLARSYQAAAPLAYVAAVAAPLGGMSQYLDLPSWLAQLMVWALLPWVWWALRRMMVLGASPFPALALGYLLVTVGYVYGTILLIVVLGACLVDCAVVRSWTAALRVVGVGAVCGLVAVTVYLPGVLTAPVTIRASRGFAMHGKFAVDTLQLLGGMLPTATIRAGTLHALPYAYAAWFLPALLWVDTGRLRRGWRPLVGLLLVTVVLLLFVVGPARMGPLRWPLRLQPVLVEVVVLGCAVVLSRFALRRPSPRRLALSLGWVGLAALVSAVRVPEGRTGVAVGGVVVVAGLVAVWLLARRPRTDRSLAVLAGVAAAISLVALAVQHAYFPTPPSPERNLPAHAAGYRSQLDGAVGDVMLVGGIDALVQADPQASRELLDGSAWYLNPHPVQNTYTTIGFTGFRDRYPYEYDGSTTAGVLDTLFTREPTTGERRVDLLSVSTLVMVRDSFPGRRLGTPPSGWRAEGSTRHTVTWVRRTAVPTAGRPVWTSAGTTVSLVSADARGASFRVDEVPSTGGRVVLSALAWPGYRTDTGTLDAPLDGYLVNVRLPADAAGSTVTVSFSPPGWALEVTTWWVGVVAALVWSVLHHLHVRRRRSRQ